MKNMAMLPLAIWSLILVSSAKPATPPDTLATPTATTVSNTAAPTPAATPTWVAVENGITYQRIAFDDMTPAGVTLKASWNVMGLDEKKRAYIGWTSSNTNFGDREDLVIFRYDPATGERTYIGSFMTASQAVGNLRDGEAIPKGHTSMILVDGKLYMASQSFHDMTDTLVDLPKYRGAHLYTIDTATAQLTDVGKDLPGGVLIEHEGIVALSIIRSRNLLVGLTHPNASLLLYNYKTTKVERIVPGIPWQLGYQLSRAVLATEQGKIYTYRAAQEVAQRNDVHTVWVYDLATDKLTQTEFTCTGGFWQEQTRTRDGKKIYVTTINSGELYELDTETNAFRNIGNILPNEDRNAGSRVYYIFGITLSPDERTIYGIPSAVLGGIGGRLYAFDLATKKSTLVATLPPAAYSGSDVRDSRGNIYIARFGDSQHFEGKPYLVVIHVGGSQ